MACWGGKKVLAPCSCVVCGENVAQLPYFLLKAKTFKNILKKNDALLFLLKLKLMSEL